MKKRINKKKKIPFKEIEPKFYAFSLQIASKQLNPKKPALTRQYWKEKASKEIKQIIVTKENIEFIDLFARALFVLGRLSEEDIQYIYKNRSYPPHIKQKIDLNPNFKSSIYNLEIKNKLKIQNKITAKNLKLKILMDIIREDIQNLKQANITKLTINKKVYFLKYLIANNDLKSTSKVILNHNAKQELEKLLIVLEDNGIFKNQTNIFHTTVEKILKNQPTQLKKSNNSDPALWLLIVIAVFGFLIIMYVLSFYIKLIKKIKKNKV